MTDRVCEKYKLKKSDCKYSIAAKERQSRVVESGAVWLRGKTRGANDSSRYAPFSARFFAAGGSWTILFRWGGTAYRDSMLAFPCRIMIYAAGIPPRKEQSSSCDAISPPLTSIAVDIYISWWFCFDGRTLVAVALCIHVERQSKKLRNRRQNEPLSRYEMTYLYRRSRRPFLVSSRTF